MRLGGVRARGHDRLECRRLRALLVQDLHEPPGHLGLRPAHQLLPCEPFVGGVGDPGRASDGGELVVVLHCSELHDDPCGGPELDPVRGERLEAGDGDVVCLEGDGRLRQLSEAGADPGKQVTLRLDDLDAARARTPRRRTGRPWRGRGGPR